MIYTISALKVFDCLTCILQPKMKHSRRILKWNDTGKYLSLSLPKQKVILTRLF